MESNVPLLKVENLKKYYPQKKSVFGRPSSWVKAVDGVSFTLDEGQTLGLVGESGCGKSTLGRQIVGLETPDSGSIWYQGKNLSKMSRKEKAQIRTEIQMVFQDSYSSLNPRKRIYEILAEPMLYHGLADRQSVQGEVKRLLELAGLSSNMMERYPHELSGGQRQRVGIAKALSLKPKLLVCDEPVSALDVSIQAQILNLLRDLQKELNLTCIFIGHGLGAVQYVSQRTAVMYLGRLVEIADSRELFAHPVHPYSQALFQAVLPPNPAMREKVWEGILQGEAAESSSLETAAGCPFYPRCKKRCDACKEEQPLVPVCEGSSHLVACSPILSKMGGQP